MERLVSVLEEFLRPRDNYTTGSRTLAFLLAAACVLGIELWLGDSNPWLIALLLAGLLNLFALLANKRRTRKEQKVVLWEKTRQQLVDLAGSLETYFHLVNPKPDIKAAVKVSMAGASSLLTQLRMNPKPMAEHFWSNWLEDIPSLIRNGDDLVAAWKNQPGPWKRFWRWCKNPRRWWRSAGSFSLRS